MHDVRENEGIVNVTWQGGNGEMPQPVPFDASDTDIKTWAAEAVRTGGVPGIAADPAVDFTHFVIDRFAPTEQRPYRLIMIRSKTPFGA